MISIFSMLVFSAPAMAVVSDVCDNFLAKPTVERFFERSGHSAEFIAATVFHHATMTRADDSRIIANEEPAILAVPPAGDPYLFSASTGEFVTAEPRERTAVFVTGKKVLTREKEQWHWLHGKPKARDPLLAEFVESHLPIFQKLTTDRAIAAKIQESRIVPFWWDGTPAWAMIGKNVARRNYARTEDDLRIFTADRDRYWTAGEVFRLKHADREWLEIGDHLVVKRQTPDGEIFLFHETPDIRMLERNAFDRKTGEWIFNRPDLFIKELIASRARLVLQHIADLRTDDAVDALDASVTYGLLRSKIYEDGSYSYRLLVHESKSAERLELDFQRPRELILNNGTRLFVRFSESLGWLTTVPDSTDHLHNLRQTLAGAPGRELSSGND